MNRGALLVALAFALLSGTAQETPEVQAPSAASTPPPAIPPPAATAAAPATTAITGITAPTLGSGTNILRAGDSIQYRIAEDPVKASVPLTVVVSSLGEASFPVTRDSDVRITLQVREKSLDEVRAQLTERLLDEYYNKANVELTVNQAQVLPGRVQFFGEMTGALPMVPDQPPITLSEAMLRMQVPDFADLKRVKIHRLDPLTQLSRVIEVDVRTILREGKRDKDVILQDGDRVEVPRKWIN